MKSNFNQKMQVKGVPGHLSVELPSVPLKPLQVFLYEMCTEAELYVSYNNSDRPKNSSCMGLP